MKMIDFLFLLWQHLMMKVTPHDLESFIGFATPLLKQGGNEWSWNALIEHWMDEQHHQALNASRQHTSNASPPHYVWEDQALIAEATNAPRVSNIHAALSGVEGSLSDAIIEDRRDRI